MQNELPSTYHGTHKTQEEHDVFVAMAGNQVKEKVNACMLKLDCRYIVGATFVDACNAGQLVADGHNGIIETEAHNQGFYARDLISVFCGPLSID